MFEQTNCQTNHLYIHYVLYSALRDVSSDEHSSGVAKVLYKYSQKLSSSQLPVSEVSDDSDATASMEKLSSDNQTPVFNVDLVDTQLSFSDDIGMFPLCPLCYC